VTSSCDATDLLSSISRRGTESSRRQLDYWDRLFLQAEDLLATPGAAEAREQMIDQLCRLMIGREDRILSLARAYFSLEDLLEIKGRMIGTGFIGGKAVGMLLARRILLATPVSSGRSISSTTTPSSSAPTSTTPTSSTTAGGNC
jgi:hypothetical protein